MLAWSDPPAGRRSLALVVEDPDAPAGTFTHWLGWNIDAGAAGCRRANRPRPRDATTFGMGGWTGPCPPPGHGSHRYVFRLYALDAKLEGGFQAGRGELEGALAGHVLATAELIGTYER